MLKLRDEIHDRLEPLTMQINSATYYHDYENIRQVAGEAWSKTARFSADSSLHRFRSEIQLIAKIEKLEAENPAEFEQLIEKLRQYFAALQACNSSDEKIRSASKASPGSLLVKLAGSALASPVIITGLIFNAIPFFIPRHLFKKIIQDKAFTHPLYFGSGKITFPFVLFFYTLSLLMLTQSWPISLLALMFMPLTGKFAYQLFGFCKLAYYEWSFVTASKTRKNKIKALVEQRQELIDAIIG